MTIADLHKVSTSVLQTYLRDPWTWLRESDLIVDIVNGLRAAVEPSHSDAVLAGPGLKSRLDDVGGGVRRRVPRVRTEAKVVRDAREQDEPEDQSLDEGGNKKQHHLERLDVTILRETQVQLCVHANGARDVVLHTRQSDVQAALEVKMCPDLYLKAGDSDWIHDVEKLSRLSTSIGRGVLLVDTSLPLVEAGVTYRAKRRTKGGKENSMERLASHTGPWPLRQAGFEVKRPSGATFRFTPTGEVAEDNLYLWALALRQEATWAPVFGDQGRVPLVKASELAPTCWEISVLPPT